MSLSEDLKNWPGCSQCVHFELGKCKAFPKGIPMSIASGSYPHLKPYPEQKGDYVFEQKVVDKLGENLS